MWKRALLRNAVAAAGVLIGLTVQASAQPAYYYDSGPYGYDRAYYGGYYDRGYYGDRYYGGGYFGGPVETGVAVAGGVVRGAGEVVGGTVGAVVGAPTYGRAYPGGAYAQADTSYCAARFRSFDPASGTYLGYDGRRHPCP